MSDDTSIDTAISFLSRHAPSDRTGQAVDQQPLSWRLGDLIKREPFSVTERTPLAAALERMDALGIGSVVVADEAGHPQGIFTRSDLLHRVVLPRLELDLPIADVMSARPLTLPASATVYDGMMAMATHGIRHVPLVDETGRLSGVISERDLFSLQGGGVGQIKRTIATAADLEALRHACEDVRRFAARMLVQGVGAEQLTRFISALNDDSTRRIIELNLRDHDFQGIEWAWLAFGSEAREEQTFTTDQDNGIVYLCPDSVDREALQRRFLDFARGVNKDLDACGFTLCKGGVMAGNPDWCLTLDQWNDRFTSWIREPEPKALLNATIFFDIRAIYGADCLAERMYRHVVSLSRDDLKFQINLATLALSVPPPLGLFRDFVTESAEGVSGFIDLKKYGSRLFVDSIRILALAHGICSAGTLERLREVARTSGGGGDDEALADAFHYIQLLRLRHQRLAIEQGRPADNRIFPDRLNQLDHRILVEACRQARRLQQRIKLKYQL